MAQKSPIPAEITTIVQTLEKAGFQAYLVGGCARDLILGRVPRDWDVTTNAKPENIQGLFSKTVYENDYGTVAVINEVTDDMTLRNVEITPYRLESGYSDRRHPDSVKFSDNLEDDLKRRDFTINAIALSITGDAIKDIVDVHGGFKDIKDKIIKTVGDPLERFNEDALRMMRAIRIAVELDFSIEKGTFEAIRAHNVLIKDIAIERVRDEFAKIILSPSPKMGIELLHETGILKHIIPELEQGIGVEQTQAHSYDVWQHLLHSLQHAADKKYDLDIRLSALFHDIAKPQTKGFSRETKQNTFYGHEVVGSRETKKILQRMKFSQKTIDKVTKLVRWHMFFADTEQITLAAVRRMIVNVSRENIWDLMNVRICDRIGMGRPKENPFRLRKYQAMIEQALKDPVSVSMLKIDGKRIMEICNAFAGPKIGFILHALFNEVLDDPALNTAELLEKRTLELYSMPEDELRKLGEKGKEIKAAEEEKQVKEIQKKYHVS